MDVHEATSQLSRLIDAALAGEDVVIARAGQPVVRLVPYRSTLTPRVAGAWKGRVSIAADFDEMPDDLAGAFRGDQS